MVATYYKLQENAELQVTPELSVDRSKLTISIVVKNCPWPADVLVHWGVTSPQASDVWIAPSKDLPLLQHFQWTDSTRVVPGAARTYLTPTSNPSSLVASFIFDNKSGAALNLADLPCKLEFVVFIEKANRWILNSNGQNFKIGISEFMQNVQKDSELENDAALCFFVNKADRENSRAHTCRWQVSGGSASFTLLAAAVSDTPDCAVIDILVNYSHALRLHWGVAESENGAWKAVDPRFLLAKIPGDEKDSTQFPWHPFSDLALQSEFRFTNAAGRSGVQHLRLVLGAEIISPFVKFVLKEAHSNNWFKADGRNDFVLHVPDNPQHRVKRELHLQQVTKDEQDRGAREREKQKLWEGALRDFLSGRQERREQEGTLVYRAVDLDNGGGAVDFIASFDESASQIRIHVIGCFPTDVTLHWGVLKEKAGTRIRFAQYEWCCPEPSLRPPNTVIVNPQQAVDTPLEKVDDNANPFLQQLEIRMKAKTEAPKSEASHGIVPAFPGLAAVLHETNGNRWFKTAAEHSDISLRLESSVEDKWRGLMPEIPEAILGAELGWNHMTIMHRYELLHNTILAWHERTNSREYPQRSFSSLFRAEQNPSGLSPGKQTYHSSEMAVHCEAASVLAAGGSDRDYQTDNELWEWMFVWARFSAQGYLEWQRNYNTKPRELAWATERLTQLLAEMWKQHPRLRAYIRLTLSCVSRGGSQGQAIRDRILDIMHKHKIPEHGGNFYEQWHQKLHNNTTPDDIPICLALMRFLKSNGDLSAYWDELRRYGVTRERLASYERKITSEPHLIHTDLGALHWDFSQYLDILRDVHDSLDLRKSFNHAARQLSWDDQQYIQGVVDTAASASGISAKAQDAPAPLSAERAHQRFCAVSEARKRVLLQMTRQDTPAGSVRDLLFLDTALEQQQIVALQAEGAKNFSLYQLADQVKWLITHMAAHNPTDLCLYATSKDWLSLSQAAANSSDTEAALLLKALSDRVALLVSTTVENWQRGFGGKAEFLAAAVGLSDAQTAVFVDEVLRGQALFGLSVAFKRMEPLLRVRAKLPPWQVISHSDEVRGVVMHVPELRNYQDRVFETPTVLVCGAVSGEEEVPAGVLAVLVKSVESSPDILSHVAVRARNAHLLLAVCFESSVAESLDGLEGKWVCVTAAADGSSLRIEPCPPLSLEAVKSTSRVFDRQRTRELVTDIQLKGKKPYAFDLTTQSKKWVITSAEFDATAVGSKSLNLARLRPKLPGTILVPEAVAFPYGTMQKTLNDSANSKILAGLVAELGKLRPDSKNAEAAAIFAQVQKLLNDAKLPEQAISAFREATSNTSTHMKNLLEFAGIPKAETAIFAVWRSLFTLRPWISLSKANRSFVDLNMAVLVQELLPARYAFVLHSRNPFDKTAKDEMYGEIVVGLGEVLVSNAAGRALSWKMRRNQSQPQICAFPSKQVQLRGASCLIFRSDSNGEDLEGFAGAGLFESVPAIRFTEEPVHYATEPLVTNRDFRISLLRRIGDLAFLIEDAFGTPMDIEGVVIDGGQLAVVQARPQV